MRRQSRVSIRRFFLLLLLVFALLCFLIWLPRLPMTSSSQVKTPSPPAQPSPQVRTCFNSKCKEPIPEVPRQPPTRGRGWRTRFNEFADLCDRCACIFEQGNFCELFHSDATGWRSCETCGKRVHCGCIVSTPMYLLLDAGGVECVSCAKKSLGLPSSQMPSSPMFIHPERREMPAKTLKTVAGGFPGQFRQGSHFWNLTGAQSDLQQRLSFEFDRPSAIERLNAGGRHSLLGNERKPEEVPERLTSFNLNNISRDRYHNGSTPSESVSTFNTYRREAGNGDGLQELGHGIGESSARKVVFRDPSSGINFDSNLNLCANSHSPPILKEESYIPAPFNSTNVSKDPTRYLPNQNSRQVCSPVLKSFHSPSMVDADSQAQLHNVRPRVDARACANLLPRYQSRMTDKDLQQISGDSNSVIVPLFEKMLSASDAGRVGRLVLPKKCAETYLPTISQPEGLPLKVQDSFGKEWVFQFRFWPNNNSRMYFLEGVTPCIQSLQLQAGDSVTFSRIDPEGKLIMGFRRASSISSEQECLTPKINTSSIPREEKDKSLSMEFNTASGTEPQDAEPPIEQSRSPDDIVEQQALSTSGKAGSNEKDRSGIRSLQGSARRKGSTLGPKNKRLLIDNEDSMELKLTWEEAQELLRPPPDHGPTLVMVEGHAFEEYEEPPVIGKRTYFTKNQTGEVYQCAQCEDCLKWRKIPVDALLPARWTCSENSWDRDRSSCMSAQESSLDQLLNFVSAKAAGRSKRKAKTEAENMEAASGLDPLDALANAVILNEGHNQPTSQQTTKHPRHRPGCSCIVCIQPPSGKGPKHKPNCTCMVCSTVKRRFKTLMLRREKQQSDKEAEEAPEATIRPGGSNSSSSSMVKGSQKATGSSSSKAAAKNCVTVSGGLEDRSIPQSPLKSHQIDLNIQPEREEDL